MLGDTTVNKIDKNIVSSAMGLQNGEGMSGTVSQAPGKRTKRNTKPSNEIQGNVVSWVLLPLCPFFCFLSYPSSTPRKKEGRIWVRKEAEESAEWEENPRYHVSLDFV